MYSVFDETTEANASKILKKAYKHGLAYDVMLYTLVDSTEVPAHRMVLIASSEYFATMFATNMKERDQIRIQIGGVTGDSLRAIIQFIYTGKLSINSNNATDLLISADLMLFETIKNECGRFFEILSNAHPERSFYIYPIVYRYSFTDLAKKSLSIICENFKEMSKQQDFNEIEIEFLEKILDSNEKFYVSEKEILEAALKWINFDNRNRKQFLLNILKLIRLPLIDSIILSEKVKPMCETSACLNLVNSALDWQTIPRENRTTTIFPEKQFEERVPPVLLVLGQIYNKKAISIESYCFGAKKWKMYCDFEVEFLRNPQFTIIDETVYVIDEKDFCFNLRTIAALTLPRKATPRKYHQAAAVDKSVYVFGGKRLDRYDDSPINAVECYDIDQKRWRMCQPMSEAKFGMGVAVIGDYIYVIGGYNHMLHLSSVERYSRSRDEWSPVRSMNACRCSPGVGVLNGKIFAVGGQDMNGHHRSVECYDPVTDTWTMVASLPLSPQMCTAAVAYENKLFALSGSRIQRYDGNRNAWSEMESLHHSRITAVATTIRW